jgi:peroxiredoxin
MDHLIGVRLPSLLLLSTQGQRLNVTRLSAGRLVLCAYPGDDCPVDAAQAPSSCAVHRASFRDRALDFAARGTRIAGISSEPPDSQSVIAAAEQLPFPLLSDGACEFADALELPTFAYAGARRYRRLTLICKGDRVQAVFYPVTPRRAAVQALRWLEEDPEG